MRTNAHNRAKPTHAKPKNPNIKSIKNDNKWKQTKMEYKQNRKMWMEEAKAWNEYDTLNGAGNENMHRPNEAPTKMNEKRQMESAKECENEGEIIVRTVKDNARNGGRRKSISEKTQGLVKRVYKVGYLLRTDIIYHPSPIF